jgi:DNA invertase Pin-like site-specific DNA recombinase
MVAKKQTATSTINVHPEDMDAVQAFMDSLNISRAACGGSAAAADIMGEDEEPFVDVKIILDHRHRGLTDWEFLVRFTDGTECWVPDADCNCETLIMKYLLTKSPETSTAFCFCRVSSKNQVGETHVSLDAQEEELIDAARAAGYSRIKIYKISGSAYKRMPKTLAAIGEGCKGEDSIFIYRVDRLSRNIITYLAWMEELDKRNVGIVSVTDDLTYRSDKLDFISAVVGAQKESALLGSRIRMSIERRKKRGDEGLGGLPYGKKYSRQEDGSLRIMDNLAELAVLKNVRDRKAKVHGKGANQLVAKHLNAAGIKKKNKKWTSAMVSRV